MRLIVYTLFTLVCSLTLAAAPAAELVVIVSKDNANAVDQKLIAAIYSGTTRLWQSGDAIVAYDLPDDSPVRAAFCTEVMGKTLANMKALNAQNVFTGKAVPPKQLTSDEEVKKAVAAKKNAIGYIKASSLDDTVKAVLTH